MAKGMLVVAKAIVPQPYQVTATAGATCLAMGVSFWTRAARPTPVFYFARHLATLSAFMTISRSFLFLALLLNSCGGKTPPPNASSQHELDQRHCTSNTECASGLCSNGRCG